MGSYLNIRNFLWKYCFINACRLKAKSVVLVSTVEKLRAEQLNSCVQPAGMQTIEV